MIKKGIKISLCGLGAGLVASAVFFPLSFNEEEKQSQMLNDFRSSDTFIQNIEEDYEQLNRQLNLRQIDDGEYFLKLNEMLSDENTEKILKSSSSPLKLNFENAEIMEDVYYGFAFCSVGLTLVSSATACMFAYANKKLEENQENIDYYSIDLC